MGLKSIEGTDNLGTFTSYSIDTDTGEIKQTKPSELIIYNPKILAQPAPGSLNLINNIRLKAGLTAIDGQGNPSKTVVNPDEGFNYLKDSAKETVKVKVSFEPKLKSQNLKYPYNMNLNQVYIEFNSYDFADVRKTNEAYNILNDIATDIASRILTFVTGLENVLPYSKDTIKIYAPQKIETSYSANWSDQAKLSIFGSQVTNNNTIQGMLTGGAADTFIKNFSDLFINNALKEGLAFASQYVPEFNLTPKDVIGLTTGMVFNRNELSTFNNINFRRFQYEFNFFARNQNEHNEIQKIINTFKVALHPIGTTVASTGSASYSRSPLLKYPKLWTMTYKIGDEVVKDIPRTKFCALTDVRVDYTPNGTLTVVGNSDIPAISMELSFLELTPLTGDQLLNPQNLNYPGDKIGGIGGTNEDKGVAVTNKGGTF